MKAPMTHMGEDRMSRQNEDPMILTNPGAATLSLAVVTTNLAAVMNHEPLTTNQEAPITNHELLTTNPEPLMPNHEAPMLNPEAPTVNLQLLSLDPNLHSNSGANLPQLISSLRLKSHLRNVLEEEFLLRLARALLHQLVLQEEVCGVE